jgi:hypothetical protein
LAGQRVGLKKKIKRFGKLKVAEIAEHEREQNGNKKVQIASRKCQQRVMYNFGEP